MKDHWREEMEFRCDELAVKCVLNADRFDKAYVLVGIDFLFMIFRRLTQIDEQLKKLPNVSSLIINRGTTVHYYIFDRLTEEEKERYYYHSYLLHPLFQAT